MKVSLPCLDGWVAGLQLISRQTDTCVYGNEECTYDCNVNMYCLILTNVVTCSCSSCTADLRLSVDIMPSVSFNNNCSFLHSPVCHLATAFFCCWRSSEKTKTSNYMQKAQAFSHKQCTTITVTDRKKNTEQPLHYKV